MSMYDLMLRYDPRRSSGTLEEATARMVDYAAIANALATITSTPSQPPRLESYRGDAVVALHAPAEQVEVALLVWLRERPPPDSGELREALRAVDDAFAARLADDRAPRGSGPALAFVQERFRQLITQGVELIVQSDEPSASPTGATAGPELSRLTEIARRSSGTRRPAT